VRIGELARRTGASVRSLRHYETKGLIQATRRSNGYREFDESMVQRVRRIRSLLAIGFTLDEILPFVPCLDDDAFDERRACAEAIALHRAKLEEIDARIRELVKLRDRLQARLDMLASRGPIDASRNGAAARARRVNEVAAEAATRPGAEAAR